VEFFGDILLSLFGAAICSVVGALLILFVTKWVLGFYPAIARCYLVSFLHHLAMTPFIFLFNFFFPHGEGGGLVKKLYHYQEYQGSENFLIGLLPLLGSVVAVLVPLFFVQTVITYYLLISNKRDFKISLKIMGVIWAICGVLYFLMHSPLIILFLISKFNVNG
jgi:hypothetical protein